MGNYGEAAASLLPGASNGAAFLVMLSASMTHAHQGAIRKVLAQHELSVPGREGVMAQTEFPPGAEEPRHTHPGDIFAYVQEGVMTLYQDGEPTVQVKAGEVFFIPAGRVHAASNDGAIAVKLLVTFFVEKGKALSNPVQ